jgi:hypothetical protein
MFIAPEDLQVCDDISDWSKFFARIRSYFWPSNMELSIEQLSHVRNFYA